MVCGLEAATSEYACIWCKCPKGQRWNMDLSWVQIMGGEQLRKLLKSQSSLSQTSTVVIAAGFHFFPIDHVTLHLFLRVGDVLIDLLIKDLRTLDGIETMTRRRGSNENTGQNVNAYVQFLNVECKIRFRWYVDKETKNTTWRDLIGPEKDRLFSPKIVSRLA